MGTKNPLNTLSRGVAQAPERTPEFKAMFSSYRVIPTTLGNLASKAVEEDIVEPSLEAVCEFFRVTPEDLDDNSIIFRSPNDVEAFLDSREQRYKEEFDGLFREIASSQIHHVLGDKAHELHAQMSEKLKASEGVEDRQARAILMVGLRAIRREIDDLNSSYETSFLNFIERALGYQGPIFFDEATILSALREVADRIRSETPDMENVKLRNTIVLRREAGIFIATLNGFYESSRTRYAKERAKRQELENILYALPYWEHPLFAGGGT